MPMEVNANYQYTQTISATVKATAKADEKAAAEEMLEAAQKQDGFVKSEASTPVTYKPDVETMGKLKASMSKNMNAFQYMVQGMFQRQAGGPAFNLKDFFSNLTVDEATRNAAAESIADDGFWGVEATAQRILDFAKAISGGDPSKIEELRSAVQKGFKAAESLWGGELPGISGQTYDRVMAGFDEWAKGGESGASTEEVSAE